MPLFTIYNISLRCPQNVSVKFHLKMPHRSFIISFFENAYFEWKQKHAIFVHVSLNTNELLLPAPFSRTGLSLYSWYLWYSAKKHLFGFDYHVDRTEIMRFKPC